MQFDEDMSFSKDEIKEMLSSKTEYVYIDPIAKKLKSRQNWLAVLGFILGKVLLYGVILRVAILEDIAGWIALGAVIIGIVLRVALYDTMFKKAAFWFGISLAISYVFGYLLFI